MKSTVSQSRATEEHGAGATGAPAKPGLRQRLQRHWATRSLGAGAVSSGVDFAVLTILVTLFHLAPTPASAIGVATGGTVAFVLNKYVAFRDHLTPVWPQALKYAGSMALAIAVHASLMYVFTAKLGIYFLIAKIIDDLLVFTIGNLAVMRLYVFRHAPIVRE